MNTKKEELILRKAILNILLIGYPLSLVLTSLIYFKALDSIIYLIIAILPYLIHGWVIIKTPNATK